MIECSRLRFSSPQLLTKSRSKQVRFKLECAGRIIVGTGLLYDVSVPSTERSPSTDGSLLTDD